MVIVKAGRSDSSSVFSQNSVTSADQIPVPKSGINFEAQAAGLGDASRSSARCTVVFRNLRCWLKCFKSLWTVSKESFLRNRSRRKHLDITFYMENERRDCTGKFYDIQKTFFWNNGQRGNFCQEKVQILSLLQNSNNIKAAFRQSTIATVLIRPAQTRTWMQQKSFL